jgi:hypothetical protein
VSVLSVARFCVSDPRSSAPISGKLLLFRSPDHRITRDHPITGSRAITRSPDHARSPDFPAAGPFVLNRCSLLVLL